MKISIVGFGYIGAVIGAVLAEKGHKVSAIDSNSKSIENLNSGICNVPEPLLKEMISQGVTSGKICGSTSYDEISTSDVVLVTVGTPLSDDFDADLSAIRIVFEKLSSRLCSGQTIMIKSTVPPGVTRRMAEEYLADRDDIFVGFSPERLAEGNAIEEFKSLPIIVGGINDASTKKCSQFWHETLGVEVIEVDSSESAELVKLANNQWIDLNVALANELAVLCDSLPYKLDVLQIIKAANSLKKGQHFVNILTPSIGVGGYCLTKDPWFVSALGKNHGANLKLPSAGRGVNDNMPKYCAERIFNNPVFLERDFKELRFAILGYSFKTNSGDTRFSPIQKFIEIIQSKGVSDVTVFDSTIGDDAIEDNNIVKEKAWQKCVKGADCVVFGAGHDDIAKISMHSIIDLMNVNGLVFDGRRFLNKLEINVLQNSGVAYDGVGRSFN